MPFEEDVAKWIAQGNAYFERGDEELADGRSTFEMAEQLYERALRYDPTNEAALSAMGVLYVATSRGPMATKILNRTRKEYPNSLGPYRALSIVMRISGKLDPAIYFFRGLLEEVPDESKGYVHLSLAELYAAKEDIASLREELRLLGRYEPIAPITQGQLFLEESDHRGIDSLLLRLDSGAAQETLRGMSAEAQGNWELAGQHFYQVSTMDSPTWYALNALAAMWLNGNQIQYCKAYLEQVEEIAPNEPEVILTKARLYQATEKYAEARKLKEHLLNLKGCFGRVRRMARAYLQ